MPALDCYVKGQKLHRMGKIPNYWSAVTKLARKYATSESNLNTRSAKNQFGVKGFHEPIKLKITEPFEVTN